MNQITSKDDAIDLVYYSYNQTKQRTDGKMTKRQDLTRVLLHAIGHPAKEKRVILVTGSKGKGSTATFISSFLTSCNYTVGLFTSPHVHHFNERIQVNGEPISDQNFIHFAKEVQPYVVSIMESLASDEYLGPIAVNLAIACLYFQASEVDYIVLECGKGGLYDDTNVIENQWAVITPILTEHIDELGPTINDIISHKLGIIKRATTVAILGKQQPEIMRTIKEQINNKQCRIYEYASDYYVSNLETNATGSRFDLTTKHSHATQLTVPLLGTFQCENIATALQACETILNERLSKDHIANWLSALHTHGRCEVIHRDPLVILDATINRVSATYLENVVDSLNCKNVLTILALSTDKDYSGVIDEICTFTKTLIVTVPEQAYLHFSSSDLYQYASTRLPTKIISPAPNAFSYSVQPSTYDLILILGNHSFIHEAKRWFLNKLE